MRVDDVVRRAAHHLGSRTENAAAHAAKDAMRAVAVRDLISDQGCFVSDSEWCQAEYDLLTQPWRKVIGPVHPEDADIPPG